LAISEWERVFKMDLEPFGGQLFFARGQSWEAGPKSPDPRLTCNCEAEDEIYIYIYIYSLDDSMLEFAVEDAG
jgi:hypothetical protein